MDMFNIILHCLQMSVFRILDAQLFVRNKRTNETLFKKKTTAEEDVIVSMFL